MFLLFLIGLGTAHVNAQVRIGGNAAPNGAAVLDLNATDAATGTKGLALPRVRLDSATVQITPGVANLNGMMVYNTTATLGVGIYFWNGSTWVKASLPATSAGDSGAILKSNGKSWIVSNGYTTIGTIDTVNVWLTTPITTWTMVLDTMIPLKISLNGMSTSLINAPGMAYGNLCSGTNIGATYYIANNGSISMLNATRVPAGYNMRIRCYRPGS